MVLGYKGAINPSTWERGKKEVKVYIVVWVDAFDDWAIEGAFSTREKAEAYISERTTSSNNFFIDEREVN